MSWMKRFAEAIGPSRSEDQGTEMTATVNSVEDDGKAYVCMAGDSRPVPAVRTAVMVSPGDTVRGKLVKGRFTIEGNLTDNAVGSTHLEKAKEHVLESAHASLKVLDDKIEMSVEDLENGMKSSITETAEEIRAEVEATYLSKEDAEEDYLSQEDAIEVYASKSLVSQTAQSITSQVATTYVNKNDAAQTYATKSSLEQTSTALTAIIDDAVVSTTQLWYASATNSKPGKPQQEVVPTDPPTDVYGAWTTDVPTFRKANKYYFYCYQQELVSGSFIWSDVVREKSITDAQSAAEAAQTVADNADALATTLSTYVRMVSGYGLLVTYTGYTVGALVRSGGSFDIVKLTWSDDTPTIGNKLSSFDDDSVDFFNSSGTKIGSIGVQSSITIPVDGTPGVTVPAGIALSSPSSSCTALKGSPILMVDDVRFKSKLYAHAKAEFYKDVTFHGDISLSSALPIGSGGTGATTKAGARSNLGIFPDVRTGGTDFGSDKSVTSDNSWTQIGYTTFPAGTWLIITRFTFKPSTSSDGSERWCAGYVGELVETNNNVSVLESGYANNTSNYVVFTVISLRTYNSSTTVYAHAKKKGSNQKVTATYRAVRLY